MSFNSLVDLFKTYGKDLKIDKSLLARLIEFNQYQLTKSPQHIEFFGGMVVGVERLSFVKDDFNRFFDDVVDMDQLGIKHDIKNTKGVDKSLSISTDPYTNTCLWLVYEAMTNKTMAGDQRRLLAFEALMAMHLRFMTQLQWKYFPYPASKEVALSALNTLNNRYDLKVYGSWLETIKARCNDALDPSWKHFKQFQNLKDADEARKMCNRLKGGIEQVYQKQANLFYDHHKEGQKVLQMSAMFDGEDGKELKALTNDFKDQQRYLASLFQDKNNFIKSNLVEVITGLVSVHEDTFRESLTWLADNIRSDRKLEDWVESVLVHSHEHIKEKKVTPNDLLGVMSSLRNVYTSSMASNKQLSDNKAFLDKQLKKWVHRKLHRHIPNVRTSVMLYIILRLMVRED